MYTQRELWRHVESPLKSGSESRATGRSQIMKFVLDE